MYAIQGEDDVPAKQVLTLDGEQKQIQVLMQDDLKGQFEEHGCFTLKFAASSSAFQQPNDASKEFLASKKALKGKTAPYVSKFWM